jgi:hypothetical protein
LAYAYATQADQAQQAQQAGGLGRPVGSTVSDCPETRNGYSSHRGSVTSYHTQRPSAPLGYPHSYPSARHQVLRDSPGSGFVRSISRQVWKYVSELPSLFSAALLLLTDVSISGLASSDAPTYLSLRLRGSMFSEIRLWDTSS